MRDDVSPSIEAMDVAKSFGQIHGTPRSGYAGRPWELPDDLRPQRRGEVDPARHTCDPDQAVPKGVFGLRAWTFVRRLKRSGAGSGSSLTRR